MKSFNNRKLLAIPGLFVALCALTSFNPFSQVNHLSKLQKEESITLAQNLPSAGRVNVRDSSGVNEGPRLQGGKIKEVVAPKIAEAAEAKPEPKEKKEADKAKGSQASREEDCTGKDCEEKTSKNSQTEVLAEISRKIMNDEKLTKEEKAIYAARDSEVASSDSSDEDSDDELEGYCVEGDYKERISCFKKTKSSLFKKKSKNSDEDRGNFKEELSDFIAEIVFDTDLEPRKQSRHLGKIARIVKDDKELSQDVRIALQALDSKRTDEAFANNLAAQAANIEQYNTRINDLQRMYGNNPYARQEIDNLLIQRKSLVYSMETDIAGYRESIRRSLPASKAGESSLIAQLRDQRTATYTDLIAPVSGAITDKRLVALDFTLSGAPGTLAQNGTVFSENGGQNTGLNSGLNSGLQAYNSQNPGQLFAGVDVSVLAGMTPMQQIEYRKRNGLGGFTGANAYATAGMNQYNNSGIPNMNQQQGPTPYQGTRTY